MDWSGRGDGQRLTYFSNAHSRQDTDQLREPHMRKLIAIIAAVGLFGSTSLPVVAAPALGGVVKSDDLSAAKKKKSKKAAKKKAELAVVTDLSAAKKKKTKKTAKKKAELAVVTELSAAKK